MGTEGVNSISGILGSILSESPAVQKTKLEAASIGAADLTNLIKRKTLATTKEIDHATEESSLKRNAKRKFECVEEAIDVGMGNNVRLSEAED